jgi:predicted XRE-type DNA-binding protein
MNDLNRIKEQRRQRTANPHFQPGTGLRQGRSETNEAMRAALAARDITLLYRLLHQSGVSQREIARHTGQSQSEVSEIVNGRTVRDVTVLESIADGLGIPLASMRLAGVVGGEDGTYGGQSTIAEPRRM